MYVITKGGILLMVIGTTIRAVFQRFKVNDLCFRLLYNISPGNRLQSLRKRAVLIEK